MEGSVSVIKQGFTSSIITKRVISDETISITRACISEALLASLHIKSITGSINVKVYTYADGTYGENVCIDFGTITSVPYEILYKKASIVLSNVRFVITVVGQCEFQVAAKGLGSGELNAKIVGSNSLNFTRNRNIGQTAQLLLPSQLSDRSGMIIFNHSLAGTLYIGTSEEDVTTNIDTKAGIIQPGNNLAIDVGSGVSIWCIGSISGMDIVIMEGGL